MREIRTRPGLPVGIDRLLPGEGFSWPEQPTPPLKVRGRKLCSLDDLTWSCLHGLGPFSPFVFGHHDPRDRLESLNQSSKNDAPHMYICWSWLGWVGPHVHEVAIVVGV